MQGGAAHAATGAGYGCEVPERAAYEVPNSSTAMHKPKEKIPAQDTKDH